MRYFFVDGVGVGVGRGLSVDGDGLGRELSPLVALPFESVLLDSPCFSLPEVEDGVGEPLADTDGVGTGEIELFGDGCAVGL